MPGIISNSEAGFEHIIVRKLHSTFAAELGGVDFSKPLSDGTFKEILTAVTKVSQP